MDGIILLNTADEIYKHGFVLNYISQTLKF